MLKLIKTTSDIRLADQDLVNFLVALHKDGEDADTIVSILSDAEKWRAEIGIFAKTGRLPGEEDE